MATEEEDEGITKQTPYYEFITINCDQETNNIIKLIKGGTVCIRGAKELFRDLMMADTYSKKIETLREEHRQALAWHMNRFSTLEATKNKLEKEQYNLEGERRYHLEMIESLEKTRIKLDKQILQQLEIIRKYEERGIK